MKNSAMKEFFQRGMPTDELYRTIRDDDHPFCTEAREFVSEMWLSVHQYMDHDAPISAMRSFRSVFWEMYLAFALQLNKVALLPRSQHAHKKHGPDLRLRDQRVWIEAVTVMSGEGADAVPDHKDHEVNEVPDEAVQLRLRQAIDKKHKVLGEYRSRGIVGDSDPYIIAISAAGIWSARFELSVHRVVRVVFPFGPEAVRFNTADGTTSAPFHTYQDHVKKSSGSSVRTDIFLDPEYSGVSGVMYCRSDELNRPTSPGNDFVFVHNPLAANPVSLGIFPMGVEYWKDGEELAHKTYPQDVLSEIETD
jgi:hypothetical protein